MDKEKTKQIGVRLPVDLVADLENLAELEDRTLSNTIKVILILYMESKESERKQFPGH